MEINSTINGLHEIHISVDPQDVALFRLYCKDKKIKPIMACSFYGAHPNQLLISKFKHGTSQEVLEKGRSLLKEMKEFGLSPIRLKIEATMHAPGAPTGDQTLFKEGDYWEFHIKVPVEGRKEYEKLAQASATEGAHLSFNVFKEEFQPLVTLRLNYPTTYNQAVEAKARLIDKIKKAGFKLNYEIHQELSVFDDNVGLDEGWLH